MIELAVICGLLVALNAWQTVDRRHERQEVAAERRDLLLRIQAPDVVVAKAINDETASNPPAVDMSDGPTGDDDWWATKELEETREQMAERLMMEEANARG